MITEREKEREIERKKFLKKRGTGKMQCGKSGISSKPYLRRENHMENRDEVILGDCLEVMRGFKDKQFDLVLTDPMYDVSEEQKVIFHKEITRVGKSAIIFMPPENQWLSPSQYGFWIKPISTKNTSRRYSRFVEMIFFYGDLKWNADRHWSQYTNVFMDLVEGDTDHPFEKPQSLVKRLILNHSNEGDTI